MKRLLPYLMPVFVIGMFLLVFFVFQETSFAQTPGGGLSVPDGYDSSITQDNNVNSFLVRITNWVLTFLFIVAVIAIIYGGILRVISGGSSEIVKKSTTVVTSAVIGLIIVISSYAIVRTVVDFGRGDQGEFTGPESVTPGDTSNQIKGTIEAYLQAKPNTGIVSDDETIGTTVEFSMEGSFDNVANVLNRDNSVSMVYMWFGDEKPETINYSNNPNSTAIGDYHREYGKNVTCTATVQIDCITMSGKDKIKQISLSEKAFLNHEYKMAGTFEAKFTIVNHVPAANQTTVYVPELDVKASATTNIVMNYESVDFSAPAPTAGFVYEVKQVEPNLIVDYWATSLDRLGSPIADDNWNPITSTENTHEEINAHKLRFDFDTNVSSIGTNSKANDNDLAESFRLKDENDTDGDSDINDCPSSTLGLPNNTIKFHCWNYPAYTVEYLDSASNQATNPPKYRVSYKLKPQKLRVKHLVQEEKSRRTDEVTREIMIPPADTTSSGSNLPPTALFSAKVNQEEKTIRLINRSLGIDGTQLEIANNATSTETVEKSYTTLPVSNVLYKFEWDLTAADETHSVATYHTNSPGSCTPDPADPNTTNVANFDDGIGDNDIDESYSGLFINGSNEPCPIEFTVQDYKKYKVQLTVRAVNLGNNQEFSIDKRIIDVEVTQPPKDEVVTPSAAFVIDEINSQTKIVQFKNTSTKAYNAVSGTPTALTLADASNTADFQILWDFDTAFDSNGDGKPSNDSDRNSTCTGTGSIFSCTGTINPQDSNANLFSPGRIFKKPNTYTGAYEVEDKDTYEIKLTLAQKVNGIWYTDTVSHVVEFDPSKSELPIPSFTYSQDQLNDLSINFLNTSKRSNGQNFENGTEMFYDLDTNIDSNNDGGKDNDKDRVCILAGTCPHTGVPTTTTYTYPNYGKYPVKLAIIMPDGTTREYKQMVDVRQKSAPLGTPVAAFSFTKDEETHQVTYKNHSLDHLGNPANTGVTYIWDLDTNFDTNGDGNSQNDDDISGNNPPSNDHFTITSTNPDPVITYSMGIKTVGAKLTIVETVGGQQLKDIVERNFNFDFSTQYSPPQANFNIEKQGTIVNFKNYSTDSRGNPLSTNSIGYESLWDLDLTKEPLNNLFPENNDGNTTNDVDTDDFVPTGKDYQLFGTYSVKLTVINPSGLKDSKTLDFTLDASQSNPNISAKINASVTDGYAPLIVEFDSKGSQDNNGTLQNFAWDLNGDGTIDLSGADRTTTSFTFENPGIYRAGLSIQGPSGQALAYTFITVLSSAPESFIKIDDEKIGDNLSEEYQAIINKSLNIEAIVNDPVTTSGNFSYDWLIDAGSNNVVLPSTSNITYTFTELGLFPVTLKVKSTTTSLQTQVTRNIRVINAPPSAMITATSRESYSNAISPSYENYFADGINPTTGEYQASFSAQDSTGAPLPGSQYSSLETFEWDFGDGSKSSSKDKNEEVLHVFTKPGTYKVVLTVTDQDGIQGKTNKMVFIADSRTPIPRISISPNTGNTGQKIIFDAGKSFSSNGKVTEFQWVVGDEPFINGNDGITFEGVKVEKTFTVPSRPQGFDVQLTITDATGETNSILLTDTLKILSRPPKTNFTISKIDGEPNRFHFDAGVTEDEDTNRSDLNFEWSFGDGSQATTGEKVEHVFDETGTYSITLSVSDGDQVSTMSKEVKVESTFIAKILRADPLVGKAPLTVSFEGTGGTNKSYGLDDGVVKAFNWDFGDQNTEAGTTVTHIFNKKGRYKVVLSAYDEKGTVATTERVIHVASADPSPLAVINDKLISGTIYKNTSVRFSGLLSLASDGTTDTQGQLLDYSWDFGDNSPVDNSPEPTHAFTAAERFTVKLTVTDPGTGQFDTDLIALQITPAKPVASFISDKTAGSSPMLVTLDASNSFDSDGEIVEYQWNFGDNTNSTTREPITNHVFTNDTDRLRTFRVILKVVDDDNQNHQVSRSINVNPPVPVTPTPQP